MSNKRTFDKLVDGFDVDELPSPPFSPNLGDSIYTPPPPVQPTDHGSSTPTLRDAFMTEPERPLQSLSPSSPSAYFSMFDKLCKDKETFFGCIPQDINVLIRNSLTYIMSCVVCKSTGIDTRRPEQQIGFDFGKTIKGYVCTLHDQCHNCNVVYGHDKAPGLLYVYKWTWINVKTGVKSNEPETVMICSECQPKCQGLLSYKLEALSYLHPAK